MQNTAHGKRTPGMETKVCPENTRYLDLVIIPHCGDRVWRKMGVTSNIISDINIVMQVGMDKEPKAKIPWT